MNHPMIAVGVSQATIPNVSAYKDSTTGLLIISQRRNDSGQKDETHQILIEDIETLEVFAHHLLILCIQNRKG